ncbi:hypothetical protein [Klebsiella quasipneumoniae]
MLITQSASIFYSRSKKAFCVAAGDFSDATAPGLTATSALTT